MAMNIAPSGGKQFGGLSGDGGDDRPVCSVEVVTAWTVQTPYLTAPGITAIPCYSSRRILAA
jgi:hypothetical protein